MNSELRALLGEAGYGRALKPDAWKSVIVFKNVGSVPASPLLPPGSFLKDFKLLLLDQGGRITHFARCAAASDPLLRRENSILEALSTQPALARNIPRTRSACSPRLRLQLIDCIPGRSYAEIVRTQDAGKWLQAVCEILEVSEAVSRSAAEVLPEFLEGGAQVVLSEAAAARLRSLSDIGVPAPFIETLRTALSSVPPLPRRLQHGDLWPGNVLRHMNSWWIIDFAEFGHAQVPMYDVFFMVHKTWLMLHPATHTHDWRRAFQRALDVSSTRLGFSQREVRAAMIYYLIHLSSYRLGHGARYQDRASFLGELLRVAESLRAGTPLEALAYPWEEHIC